MALYRYNFGVDQGSDLTIGFTFANEDPSGDLGLMTYFNLTGAGIRLQLRSALDSGSTEILALTVGTGITLTSTQITGGPAAPTAPNGFTVTITKTQSLTFTNGALYFYDCFVDLGALSTLYLQGTCQVGTTVTR